MWQDYIISIGQFILTVSLLPAARAGVIMPLTTSIPTACVLGIFAITFMTMNIPLSVVSSLLGSLLWCWFVVLGILHKIEGE